MNTNCTGSKLRLRAAGFTLVEMLVVIAIISILVGLLASGITGAILGGKKTKELNRLKQVMMAWQLYSGQYEDQLLPGFLDVGVQNNWSVNYRNQDGSDLPRELCQTYTWRLLPFLDYAYEPILGYRESVEENVDESIYNTSEPPVTEIPALAPATGLAGAGASLQPGFGYNAYYCGGWWTSNGATSNMAFSDGTYSDGTATVRGRLVARTIGGISKPSEFVVFSGSTFLDAGTYGPLDDYRPGAAWCVPNRLGPTAVWGFGGATLEQLDVAQLWEPEPTDIAQSRMRLAYAPTMRPAPSPSKPGKLIVSVNQAVPLARFGDTVSIGLGDGSTRSSSMAELEDIRLWVPRANTPNFTHTP